MRKHLITVALLAGTFLFTSCDGKKEDAHDKLADAQQEAKEERAEVAEDLQEAKDKAADKRAEITAELKEEEREFLRTMEESRTKIDNRIAEIDRKIDKANDTEKIRLRAQRERLNTGLKDVDNDIIVLKGGVKSDWYEFKSDFQRKFDKIKRDLKD